LTKLRLAAFAVAACVAVVLCGIAAVVAESPLRLPRPSGSAAIGTTDVPIGRGVRVRFWYPAHDVAGARTGPYRPDVIGRSMRDRIMFPLVRPAAYVDVPVAAGRHPLLVYVPGWGDSRTDNTLLCEDLASHGFIIAAIDDLHPVPAMDFSSHAAYQTTIDRANAKVRLQADAVSDLLTSFAGDKVPAVAQPIVAAMDLGRVAAIGYSFGGATAAEAAARDSRIRGAVDLDGWTFGDAALHGVPKPFMIVTSGAPTLDPPPSGTPLVEFDPYEAELTLINEAQINDGFRRYGGYNVSIDGTEHDSYCDSGLFPKLRRQPGSIDNRRAFKIVATYVVAFFNTVLNGIPSPLLKQQSEVIEQRSSLDKAALVTIWSVSGSLRPAAS
jgi:dienelactone hydrolase